MRTVDRQDHHIVAIDQTKLPGALGTAPNLASDVPPRSLVTAVVTEDRLVRPALGERPA